VPNMVILYDIHKQMSCFPVSIVVQTLDNQISLQTNNRIYVTILFYNIAIAYFPSKIFSTYGPLASGPIYF
jgi:hypothetical protein